MIALLLCLSLTPVAALAEAAPVASASMNVTLLTQQGGINNKYVTGSAAIGDTVYVLTSQTLERWAPGDTQTVVLPLVYINADYGPTPEAAESGEAELPTFNRLLTDGEALYGFNRDTGTLWTLAHSAGMLDKPTLFVQLDWAGMKRKGSQGDYEYVPQIGDALIMDGILYMALTDWEVSDKPYELCGWDLATGKLTVDWKGLPMRTLAPYQNGLLIGKLYDEANSWDEDTQTQKMPQLATLDPKTGETKELLTFTGASIYGVRYNAATDTLYYIDGATVYRMTGLTQPATVSAYLPNRVWDDASVSLLPGGMYAVADYNGLIVRGLDMPGIENGALTVLGEYGSSGHLAYVSQYPQALVTCSEAYYSTLEEFAAAMVSGSDTVDVLRLGSDYTPLNRLIDKGYAQDLSSFPALMALANRMDPNLTKLCMRDGKLYGLPVSMYGNSIGYNRNAWEALGLTEADVPATFEDLLDFVANWQADYGEDHPEYMLTDNGVAREALMSWLMDAYVAEQARAGQMLSFDTELFRTLAAKLESIDFSEMDVPYDEQNEEFWSRQSVFSTYTVVTYPGQYRYDMQFIPLPLAAGLEPVMPTSVEYLVVNPRTTHLEQAVQYLTVYVSNLDKTDAAITLFPDNNEPMIDPTYETNRVQWEKDLVDFEARLETATEAEKADIKYSIEYFKRMLNDADTYRYSVAPKDIATYRNDVAPYLVVTGQTPLKTWNKEGNNEFYTLRDQYMQGAIKLDQFLKEMDKRLRMMQLEDQ
jgi:ABC-type glycerol-3-phosphate transport system substrate-binding protein